MGLQTILELTCGDLPNTCTSQACVDTRISLIIIPTLLLYLSMQVYIFCLAIDFRGRFVAVLASLKNQLTSTNAVGPAPVVEDIELEQERFTEANCFVF